MKRGHQWNLQSVLPRCAPRDLSILRGGARPAFCGAGQPVFPRCGAAIPAVKHCSAPASTITVEERERPSNPWREFLNFFIRVFLFCTCCSSSSPMERLPSHNFDKIEYFYYNGIYDVVREELYTWFKRSQKQKIKCYEHDNEMIEN